MKTAALFAAIVFATVLSAQEPEQCLAKAASGFEVSHAGKSYRMATEACRAQFLTDPERYAQLYDALIELEREGTPLAPPVPSLVPS